MKRAFQTPERPFFIDFELVEAAGVEPAAGLLITSWLKSFMAMFTPLGTVGG